MVVDFNKKYMYIAVDIENNFIESTRWINTKRDAVFSPNLYLVISLVVHFHVY